MMLKLNKYKLKLNMMTINMSENMNNHGCLQGLVGFFSDQNIIFVSTCSYRRELSEKHFD